MARLLTQYLAGESEHLHRLGYRLDGAFPNSGAPDGFRVSLLDADGAQLVVDLHAPETEPSARAARLAEQLLRTHPDQWQVFFHGINRPRPDAQ